jgi:FkbM family methyltransferase
MKRILFFLRSYSLGLRLPVLFLLLFEKVLNSRLRRMIFGNSLVESRSILGFILDNHGKITPLKNGMLVNWNCHGKVMEMFLRWSSSDFAVFEQVIIKEEYSPIVHKIKKMNQECAVIVDVGANIGCAGILFSAFFPNAFIVAIEPDPANYIQLQSNFKRNLKGRYALLKKALWHETTMLNIKNNFKDGRDWSKSVENEPGEVRGTTLRAIIDSHNLRGIDLLKIDIEGAEKHLFKDIEFEQVLLKVKFLAMEVHDVNDEKTISRRLENLNYDLFNDGETLFAVNQKMFL